MFVIKAPTEFSGTGYGLIFVSGIAHTQDKALANKLSKKGYCVESTVVETPETDLDKMSLPELKSLAKKVGVDSIGAKTREDFISRITENANKITEDKETLDNVLTQE